MRGFELRVDLFKKAAAVVARRIERINAGHAEVALGSDKRAMTSEEETLVLEYEVFYPDLATEALRGVLTT